MRGQRPALRGRDRALATMTESLSASRTGRSSTVLLSGEAGIGKTRLAEEAVAVAQAAGDAVVIGRCWPVTGSSPPYGPIVDLVRELVRLQPGLPEEISAEVSSSLRALVDGPDAGGQSFQDPRMLLTRLAAGTTALLRAASTRQPLVAVVEDVHWADRASTDLLSFWARKLAGYRITLLLTTRTDEPRRSAGRGWLTELRRLPDTVEIGLGPLSDGDIAELITALPDAPADPGPVVALCQGNPFFALHLAVHGNSLAVSPTLRGSLLAPVESLDTADRELLHILAVLGEGTGLELASAASGLTLSELAASLDRLLASGLLGNDQHSITLRHSLLRDVVLTDMLPSERVLAHTGAVAGLFAIGLDRTGDGASRLGFHLLEAGRQGEALHFLVRGARRAADRWAFQSACDLYESARRLWRVVPDAEERAGSPLSAILRENATALQWLGRPDDALSVLDEAQQLHTTDPVDTALLHHARGQVLWATGLSGESLAAYETAVAALCDYPDARTHAVLLSALAAGYMLTGHGTRARETADLAVPAARAVGDQRTAVHASITRAVALAQLGDLARAAEELAESVPAARAMDDLELVNRAYGNLTFVLYEAGRFADAERAGVEGEATCRRYGPVLAVASTMMNNHMAALVALGRWDEAEELAAQALAETVPRGAAQSLHTTLAGIAVARGRYDTMSQHLDSAFEIADQDPYSVSAVAIVRAEAALWQGRPADARDIVRPTVAALVSQDDPIPLLNACRVALRAAADLHAPDPELSRLVGRAGSGSAAEEALRSLCRAEHHRAADRDTATEWVSVAEREAALQRPYSRAYALYRAATRDPTGPALGPASRLAADLAAEPLLQALAALTAPVVRPYGLTERELEVLALLAGGQTNRDISKSLYISDRTAGVHVSNILAKLQVTNRTEAAALAHRAGLADTVRGERP